MWKMIGKAFLLYLGLGLVSGLVVLSGGLVLGVIFGALLYLGFVLMMFGEGSSVGEHDCGISDTVKKLTDEGKAVTTDLQKQTFKPSKGILAAVVFVAPFVIITVLNLILADPNAVSENRLGVVTRILCCPELFITRLCTETIKYDISGTTAHLNVVLTGAETGFEDIAGLVRESGNAGTVYAQALSLRPLTLMRILYIPAVILPAVALGIGYLLGPVLRKKTVDEMLKGTRKKLRKMKRKTQKTREIKPQI